MRLLIAFVALFTLVVDISPTDALQDEGLLNGDFEVVEDGSPTNWFFSSQSGGKLSIDSSEKTSGDTAILIDASEPAEGAQRLFANLSQTIDGKPFRGKRIRFRASVKTAEFEPNATANLWFRVDRETEDDSYLVGAFDNMQDRPILKPEWDQYEIVLDVDEDAKQIIVGMFVIGQGKAWIDDASFEEVGDDVETTELDVSSAQSDSSESGDADDDEEKKPTPRFQMDPLVMKAFQEADKAPRQPFFTHWLWLVALTVLLFALSGLPAKVPDDPKLLEGETPKPVLGIVPRFAVRFSCCYWVLYSFPILTGTLVSPLMPKQWGNFQVWYSEKKDALVHWTAEKFFDIEGKMVPVNGSGDTTSAYITLFVVFALALILAVIWSLIQDFIRKTDHRYIKDILRSYLRYVLAFWMLSYGLGKVALVFNQFPTVSEYQFNKNWGDSSPMNVVWSFMGSSQAYTIFAGLGETVGALLLVWRRTAIIGALVTLGVMINVMMLNYCYDVPVKLFSTNLVFMAIFILIPDAGRLLNVMLFNRPTEQVDMRPPYTNKWTIWIQRALKITVIGWMIVWPCWEHYKVQAEFIQKQKEAPEYFGSYEVVDYKLNGNSPDEDNEWAWKSVRFVVGGDFSMEGRKMVNKVIVGMKDRVGQFSANFVDEDGDGNLVIDQHANSAMLQGEATFQLLPSPPSDDEQDESENGDSDVADTEEAATETLWVLKGRTAAGEIEVTLKPNENVYLLTGRGFRWINEVPFNR